MEEKEIFNDTETMMRLNLKAKLIKDCSFIFSGIAKNINVLPKKFRIKSQKSIMNDFKKGIKIIDKKVPVFIELPTLNSKGNGMYTKVPDKKDESSNAENEIIVNSLDYTNQKLLK